MSWLEKGIKLFNEQTTSKFYVCGGQVRDYWVGKQVGDYLINESNEIDVVIFCSIEEFKERFPNSKKNKGSSFEVFDVFIEEYRYEVKITTGTLEDDILTRDLNINSMYIDSQMNIINEMTSNVLDIVKDDTFIEDPIRIIKWDLTISKLKSYNYKFKQSPRLQQFSNKKDSLLRTQSPNRIEKVFKSRGYEIINVTLRPEKDEMGTNRESIIKNYYDGMIIYGFDKKWFNLMNQHKRVFWNVTIELKQGYYTNNIDFRKQAKHWNIKYIWKGDPDYNFINGVWKLPDSPHFKGHQESVKEHIDMCIVEARMQKLDKLKREVVKYHDYGKLILADKRPFDKEIFYGHEFYSSYLALFLKRDIAPQVSAYILFHMKREHEYLDLEWFNQIDNKCRIKEI